MSNVPHIHDVLRRRASTRAFGPEPVDDDTIHALLEAARWAPSWGNLQPWRLVVVRDAHARAAVGEGFTRGNAWAKEAPVLVVIAADPTHSKSRGDESYYRFDCGLATANLIVEAVSRGLVAHPFGGWDEERVRTSIGAPDATRIVVIVAIGYPGSGDPTEQRIDGKPDRPRERLPLTSIAYAERWAQPLPFLENPIDGT